LYTSCVLGLRPFALFYELLLIKKKKKDFVGDEAELVTLLLEFSDLNSGGNVCRSEGMPHLVWQVDPNEGTDRLYLLEKCGFESQVSSCKIKDEVCPWFGLFIGNTKVGFCC
jgi:hypothetical protein